MPEFGEKLKCSIKDCPMKAEVLKNNKLFCRSHIPKRETTKLGHYPGKSNRPYGEYDKF